MDLDEERRSASFRASYIPSPHFLRCTTWYDIETFGIKTLFDEHGSDYKRCSIIGRVVPADFYMDPHGDFKIPEDPQTSSYSFTFACLRFSLCSPDHDGLAEDFRVGLKRLNMLVKILGDRNLTMSPFIGEQDGRSVLNFRFRLFETKVHIQNFQCILDMLIL